MLRRASIMVRFQGSLRPRRLSGAFCSEVINNKVIWRVVARHTAPLPPVDLIVKAFSSPATLAVIPNVANGDQVVAELPVNTRFRVQFALVGTTDPVRVSSVKARPGETVIYHAVGSIRKNTFTLIELRVRQ